MAPEEKQNITLRLWPVSPIFWFTVLVLAILFDVLTFVERVSSLLTEPIDINFHPEFGAPQTDLVVISSRFDQFFLVLFAGGLPSLLILFATWRRWVHAAKRPTNYWVWTVIEGIAIPIKLFSGTLGFPGFLLWAIHTIAKPGKLTAIADSGAPAEDLTPGPSQDSD